MINKLFDKRKRMLRLRLTSGFHPNDVEFSDISAGDINTQMSAEYVITNPSGLQGHTFYDGTPDTASPDAAGNTYRVFFYGMSGQLDPLHAAIEFARTEPHESEYSIASLEGFELTRIPKATLDLLFPTAGTPIKTFTFNSGDESWTQHSVGGDPWLLWDSGALKIRGSGNNTETYAYWQSPANQASLKIKEKTLYKIVFHVYRSSASAADPPPLELSVFTQNDYEKATVTVKSNESALHAYASPSNNPLDPTPYAVYFYPNQSDIDDYLRLRFAMSYRSTETGDQTGSLFLKKAVVYSLPVDSLP
jgi:hypothetical protein